MKKKEDKKADKSSQLLNAIWAYMTKSKKKKQ